MKKIFYFILISFYAILNVQAQTKTVSKDSLCCRIVFAKAETDAQLSGAAGSSKQNLTTDSSEKNKTNKRYGKVIIDYVVSKISDSSFVRIEVNTKFPDDAERLKKYLLKNLNANTPGNNKAKPGTYQVIVVFIESKDGTTSAVTPLTNAGYGMEAEVVKLIAKSSRWAPATQNGNTVRQYRK
jgi:hypothetical protein